MKRDDPLQALGTSSICLEGVPEGKGSARSRRRCDCREVGAVLAAAFAVDPVWQWVLGGRARDDRLRRAFTATTRVAAATPGARVLLCSRGAAALWFAPGRWRPPLRASLPHAPALLSALRGGSVRVARLQRAMAHVHPAQPHWYLEALGAVPAAQGTGAGAALRTPVLRLCDSQLVSAYLESSSPRNWSFCERYGFQQVGAVAVPDGCPPMMTFLRAPR